MINHRFYVLIGALALLSGCTEKSSIEDLKGWMSGLQNTRGDVQPLPPAKPYEPFLYNAFNLPDPFKPRKVTSPVSSGLLQPDINRPRQLLENYPLESLTMVGVLERKKIRFAVVRASDNSLHQIKVGNYMGQNFGRVVAVTESEIKLKELVQDVNSEWVERDTNVQLLDAQQENKK
ncbi:MAG: pilus assembly protein PilP [Pseudomonadota bacterium]